MSGTWRRTWDRDGNWAEEQFLEKFVRPRLPGDRLPKKAGVVQGRLSEHGGRTGPGEEEK